MQSDSILFLKSMFPSYGPKYSLDVGSNIQHHELALGLTSKKSKLSFQPQNNVFIHYFIKVKSRKMF